MDYLLREQERLQSRVRRFESPDEYPFFPSSLEKPILQPLSYPRILHDNDVSVNEVIKQRYVENILPAVCTRFGDRGDRGEKQENYGSAATCDVSCLQALSRRIHFGKFVAESKFQKETEKFVALIKAEDRKGIDDAITDAKVEQKVLERLALKAKTYGTDPGFPDQSGPKIDVNAVQAMYKVKTRRNLPGFGIKLTRTGICHSFDQGRGGRVSDAALEGYTMGVNPPSLLAGTIYRNQFLVRIKQKKIDDFYLVLSWPH